MKNKNGDFETYLSKFQNGALLESTSTWANEKNIKISFNDDCEFDGSLDENTISGIGIQTWANGRKVEGTWKNGYLQGDFKITDKNGKYEIFNNRKGT